jgi:hypothetical protein
MTPDSPIENISEEGNFNEYSVSSSFFAHLCGSDKCAAIDRYTTAANLCSKRRSATGRERTS